MRDKVYKTMRCHDCKAVFSEFLWEDGNCPECGCHHTFHLVEPKEYPPHVLASPYMASAMMAPISHKQSTEIAKLKMEE